jgi:hypothetical protein
MTKGLKCVIFLFLVYSTCIEAQQWSVLEKQITVGDFDLLSVNHAEGHLFLEASETDSISISAHASCEGCTPKEVESFKTGIEIKQRSKGKELIFSTRFTERLFFKEALNWVRRDQLSIDIKIKVPKGLNCNLKLRKVYAKIENVRNQITADIQNTRLLAEDAGSLNIQAEYSKVKVERADALDLSGQFCDVFSYYVKDVQYKAMRAKFKTHHCDRVQFDLDVGLIRSESDKKVFVTTERSTVDLINVKELLDLTTMDSKVSVHKLAPDSKVSMINGSVDLLVLDNSRTTLLIDARDSEIFVHTEGARVNIDLKAHNAELFNEITGVSLNPRTEILQESDNILEIKGSMHQGKFVVD